MKKGEQDVRASSRGVSRQSQGTADEDGRMSGTSPLRQASRRISNASVSSTSSSINSEALYAHLSADSARVATALCANGALWL